MNCNEKSCRWPNCRRQKHHGHTFAAVCPKCGATKELAEIGVKPNEKAQIAGSHHDWRHAAGVTCIVCNYYFMPQDTAESLLSTLADWEHPYVNPDVSTTDKRRFDRPPADLSAMQTRLRARVADKRSAQSVLAQ